MPQEFTKYVRVRLYGNLNDFLPKARRQSEFTVNFWGSPTVKDIIEAVGAPHVEIFFIQVDGEPVNFDFKIKPGSLVSCFPKFFNIPKPEGYIYRIYPEPPRYILDVHLGRLCAYLRLLGIDTLYSKTYSDEQIITLAVEQQRIILTRDIGILKNRKAVMGYFVRTTKPKYQLIEVATHFNLKQHFSPFSRCSICNEAVETVSKAAVKDLVPKTTFKIYSEFYKCKGCGKIYWEGPHFVRINKMFRNIL